MDDFTLRIANLPNEEWIERDEMRMKEYLHKHFGEIIKLLRDDDTSEIIADINFGEATHVRSDCLQGLKETHDEYH